MRIAASLLALLLCACATSIPAERGLSEVIVGPGGRDATFEYLGAGGWLIRAGGDAVLTAPFFTNPAVGRIAFGRLRPNRAVIERHLPKELDDVRVVLAGHAHYDHIMDLPVVLPKVPPDAPLAGGPTVCNILSSALAGHACVPLTDYAGTHRSEPGKYEVAGGRVVIRPYFSAHASHREHIKAMYGHYSKPQGVPTHALGWREGETLAYLIDFMQGDKIALRVYYQDTAANSPYGIPDRKTLDEKPIDVAILCVASFHEVEDHPEALIALQPAHLLLGHWEDFFHPADAPERPVRFTDVDAFIDRVKKAEKPRPYTLPTRHQVITVKY